MDEVTLAITTAVVSALALAPLIMTIVFRTAGTAPDKQRELWNRYRTWLALAPLMLGLVLIGPVTTIVGVAVLSLFCYREFARATGLFRERTISVVVVISLLAVFYAVADAWYGLFVALTPICVSVIAAIAVLSDRPNGYIQRVGLATLGFLLFGVFLGHLAYFANDTDYRPLIMTIVLCVEMNDIFAYLVGRSVGRRKLAPNTSPGKTIGGAVGALVLTTTLFTLIGHFVFRDDPALSSPVLLITLGALISVAGQLGDLMMSSIKRDLGLKDIGATLPGHGGLLDRFDSLILAAPAAFHFIAYFGG
jgi:phosphatidate cytidylyltransferase